jgi:hypothetical protein
MISTEQDIQGNRCMTNRITFRGSRKHVLDWTSRPEFSEELLALVTPVDVKVTTKSQWMPKGYGGSDEARLETFGPPALPDVHVWPTLRSWWLAHEHGANTPNWDIALSGEVEGRPGLLLVEAKANVPELSSAGKALNAAASAASRANHERIGTAIAEACTALQRLSVMTAVGRDSHYQLSNRVAFAWKLVSLGIPTVLVYLGFCGDQGIADAGEPIRDASHWNDVFAAHAYSAIPADLFERRIDCGAAPVWFLVRSRNIIQPSPPRRTSIVAR